MLICTLNEFPAIVSLVFLVLNLCLCVIVTHTVALQKSYLLKHKKGTEKTLILEDTHLNCLIQTNEVAYWLL